MKVLKFYADWCGPCKSLSAMIEKNYTGNVPIESIDIDKNTDLAVQYGVRGVPLCILLDEHGSEIRRQSGMMMADQFENFMKG